MAQSDGPPAEGRYPTSFWPPGTVIEDERVVAVPATTPPGSHGLRAGLYRVPDGARLPVSSAGLAAEPLPAPADAVPLGLIQVASAER